MPFGINSAPEKFQRPLDKCLEGLENITVIHDVKIFGSGGSISISYNIAFETLLNRYREKGLRLNVSSVKSGTRDTYWEQMVCRPTVRRSKKYLTCLAPTEVQEVQHLIGLHLSKFLPQLSTICEPLHRLTIGNSVFDWLTQHGDVFCKVMEMITKASVLRNFYVNKGVVIECSSPGIGLGNVLTQDGRPSSISLIRAYTIQVQIFPDRKRVFGNRFCT